MTEPTYLTLDLQIEPVGEIYRAQVLDSPAGQAQHEFSLPFSAQEREALDDLEGSPFEGADRVDAARQAGERLFQAVFASEVYACFRSSLRAAQADGKGLRLRLRLNAASLNALPWEFLYDPQQERFLVLSTETPVTRYIELPRPYQSMAVPAPLRILALLASPPDFPPLDLESEWNRLQQALAVPLQHGLVTLERLSPPSLGALQRYLRKSEVHVFHFDGHGAFRNEEGVLVMQDDTGGVRFWNGAALAAVLADHRPLRLVFLNACEGARGASPRLFSGVAQVLVQQNVPAVIAMRTPISDQAGLTFAQDFYAALVDGYPVDAALSEGRKAIFIQGSGIEWASPVYYSRTPEGRLLDLSPAAGSAAGDQVPRTALVRGPASGNPRRVFISHRHKVEPDERLSELLYQKLGALGHLPFIDRSMDVGTAWLDEIDEQIRQSDFLVVLLSHQSADSEMVKGEIRRAFQYFQRQGKPRILPVRIGYSEKELLPYAIDAFLDPVQYVSWREPSDDQRVTADILRVIEGGKLPPPPQPTRLSLPTQGVLSEDGRLLPQTSSSALIAPLPEFDPRFLDDLEAPGGALRPNDRFYIERPGDHRLQRELLRLGSTVTILGSRQVGKSSLLVRGLSQARPQIRLVHCDLQALDRSLLQSPEAFLKSLAQLIARKAQLPRQVVEQTWQDTLGPQDNLTKLMEEAVLPADSTPLVLALDEADRLLETSFATDFFALMRSWHNTRALDDLWSVFNLVMVISTEPYLLISDPTQSPFNVGLKLAVDDFTSEQVQDLNQRHGDPVSAEQFPRFIELLNGHPYLTRKALYTLVAENVTWEVLLESAASESGPFSDHLRHQLWLLRDEKPLQESLKQIIRNHRCSDAGALFRLQRAGLVKSTGEVCTCRCELYALYFKDKFS